MTSNQNIYWNNNLIKEMELFNTDDGVLTSDRLKTVIMQKSGIHTWDMELSVSSKDIN